MLKVLLCSAPDVIPGFDLLGRFPNLGLISIAGNVDKDVCRVRVADLVLVAEDVEGAIATLVHRKRPDLVGFSCMTFQYPTAIQLAEEIRA